MGNLIGAGSLACYIIKSSDSISSDRSNKGQKYLQLYIPQCSDPRRDSSKLLRPAWDKIYLGGLDFKGVQLPLLTFCQGQGLSGCQARVNGSRVWLWVAALCYLLHLRLKYSASMCHLLYSFQDQDWGMFTQRYLCPLLVLSELILCSYGCG